MAVNINIDVKGPNGLLNSNRIQVAANRSAQQEKETKRAIQKKATPLREENLEEQSSPYASRKRLEVKAPSAKIEEPTANLFDDYPVMVVPFLRNYSFDTGLGTLQVWSQNGSQSIVDQINTGPVINLPDPIYEIQEPRPISADFPNIAPQKWREYSGCGKTAWSSSWPSYYQEVMRDGRVGHYERSWPDAPPGLPDPYFLDYFHPDYNLMTSGASRSRQEWVSTYSEKQVWDDYYFCLPLGKDRCIFYYTIWGKRWSSYIGRKFSVTQTWRKVADLDQVYPVFFNRSLRYIYEFFGTDHTRTLIDQFDIEQEYDVFYEACFLVSNNAVKKISVPEAFSSAKEKLFIYAKNPTTLPDPPRQSDVGWTQGLFELAGAGTFIVNDSYEGIDSEWIPYDIQNGYPKSPTAYNNIPSSFYYWPVYGTRNETAVSPPFERYKLMSYSNYLAELNIRPKPTVSFEVLSHYGLADFYSSYHGVSDTRFSPGVYAVLNNAESIRLDTDNTKYVNYQQLEQTYLSSKSTKIFINTQDFWFTKTKPININTPMPSNEFKKNPAALKITKYISNIPSPQADYFLVWNWNQAAYCRQQAGLLGFTAQDLSFE